MSLWYTIRAMKNPFHYGSKVSGEAFYDRREIKAFMMNALDGCNNVVLYGPRRYGKSSLVAEMMDELSAKGTTCVYLNMMNVASLADFILAYSKVAYDALAPVSSALSHISGFFKRIRPVIGVDDGGKPELTFAFGPEKVGVAELREVLDLPARLQRKRQPLVIVIDEFQEVSELGLGTGFEKVMRSVIENHADIGYVFLGSKTHMLKRMFSVPARPFYRSAQTFSLSLPPIDESREFLVSRFRSVRIRLADSLADEMVQRAGNVPYYLQAIGSWTFRSVSERNATAVRSDDVEQAFERMYAAERDLFENLFRALPESQRLVARAIAREPVAKFTDDYRTRHFLPTSSTVGTAVRRLVQDSRIDVIDGRYQHVDPIFAHYLREGGGF